MSDFSSYVYTDLFEMWMKEFKQGLVIIIDIILIMPQRDNNYCI